MARKLYVCISLDVEEEGLFSGAYAASNVTVKNVSLLKRLAPISSDLGLPLTLFCAYSVFEDKEASATILWLRDNYGAEIGAHLHHWSTPPIEVAPPGTPERTHRLNHEILAARLANLLTEGQKVTGTPLTSFRMGRWDLKKELLPLLARNGIKVDSSVCPLRAFRDGPDHFLAPSIPWWVHTEAGPILEAPLTQVPLWPPLAILWHKLWHTSPRLLDTFHFFGALSPNPVWHSLSIMKVAAKLNIRRGNPLLNLFLHSSELMPGGSPHTPNQAASDALLAKLTNFCRWLRQNFDLSGITASAVADLPCVSWPVRTPAASDW